MKRLLAVLMLVVMGVIAGCGGKEDEVVVTLPHNDQISLVDSCESIIEKDELIELTEDNPSFAYFNQISSSYENAEDEIGKQYVKSGNSYAYIDGYEFRAAYVIHDDKGLHCLRYRAENIDEFGREELLEYLISLYGEEIKNAEFAFYSEYHQIKVNVEDKIYIVQMGIPNNYPDELWIEIMRGVS